MTEDTVYATVRQLAPSEGGGWLAEIPDLPGCVSDGETFMEAVENVHEAMIEWCAANRSRCH